MDVHELTAAYALDALDAGGARAYEAHLGSCARMPRGARGARRDGGRARLGASSRPSRRPRCAAGSSRRRRAERENVDPAAGAARWVVRTTAAVAAVAACAAVALGVWARRSRTRSTPSARPARRRRARCRSSRIPRRRRSRSTAATGTLAVDPTGRAVLVVHAARRARPADKIYEAWVIPPGRSRWGRDSSRAAARRRSCRSTSRCRPAPSSRRRVERAGGVDAPTDTPILTAQT